MFHQTQSGLWVWSHAPLAGTTFFEARWRGLYTVPEAWVWRVDPPALRCRIWADKDFRGSELDRATGALELTQRIACVGWHNASADLHGQLNVARESAMALQAQLLEDGWVLSGGEGLVRDVAVDDLEKVEVMPPAASMN